MLKYLRKFKTALKIICYKIVPPKKLKPILYLPKICKLKVLNKIIIEPLTDYFVTNPSIIYHNGSYKSVVRGCNYDLDLGYLYFYGSHQVSSPDTQNYLLELDNNFAIIKYWFIEDRHIRADIRAADGVEDLRLFVWRDEYWVIGSALQRSLRQSTIVLCKLDGFNLSEPVFIDSPFGNKVEKNWMPWVIGIDLYFIYKSNPLSIFKYVNGILFPVINLINDSTLNGYSGSSCIIPFQNNYLGVIHKKIKYDNTTNWSYEHRLIEYNTNFQVVGISQAFRFESDAVEFCAGIALVDDFVVFSYGIMDKKGVILKLPLCVIDVLFVNHI